MFHYYVLYYYLLFIMNYNVLFDWCERSSYLSLFIHLLAFYIFMQTMKFKRVFSTSINVFKFERFLLILESRVKWKLAIFDMQNFEIVIWDIPKLQNQTKVKNDFFFFFWFFSIGIYLIPRVK